MPPTAAVHPLFARLPEQTQRSLPKPMPFGAGDFVLREGDAPRFCFLFTGVVEVSYTSADGEQMTPKIFSAPAVFGEVECITQSPMRESVQALSACSVVSIDAKAFERLTDELPGFTKALLWDVARRFETCILNERLLVFGRAHARVVSFFLSSIDAHGATRGSEVVIRRALSQDALAAAVGVNRRSVTRALEFLKAEGVVKKEGRHFVVSDVEKLRLLAGGEAVMLHHRMSG